MWLSMMRTFFATLLFTLLLPGCANYTASIRSDALLNRQSAYLYGRFRIKSEKTLLGMDGYQTMGLRLHCANGQDYTVRFSIENRVQVIQIKPSRCALVEVLGTDADGVVRMRRRPPRAWSHADNFTAGNAYYLGDFFATAVFSSEFKVLYSDLHWSWDMEPVDDGFETTTADFRRAYKSLASLPIDDLRLVPRPPPPPPGALGPPISAAEAAEIAPYVNRSYRSVDECKAACRMGRCVPYRGASGPAMTCIVRCKIETDCPEGLSCNCEHPEGRECHTIAQIPGNPMEGLCLSPEAAAKHRQ
jgi:hypothetical protein